MNFLFVLPIAWRALKRNKLRSALTMLGIIIGVAAVIAMVALGNGAKAQMLDQIASLGQNVLLVWPGSITQTGIRTGWGGSSALTVEDAEAIRRECPSISLVSPGFNFNSQVIAGNQNWYTQLQGVGVDFFEIRDWPLERGVPFTETDIRNASKVAILGRTVAEQLFGDEDPSGQIVRIRKVPCVVVGLLTPKGQNMWGMDQDDTIMVPYTTAMKRLQGSDRLRSIHLKAVGGDQLDEAKREVEALLRQRHRVPPDMPDDFTVRNQTEIADFATAQIKTMTALLGAIASVSLIVGGIGIMNIMLVSVTERTREIGIRMAIGAMGRDILVQFLVEAVVLSVIGGLIGIALGIGVSRLIAADRGWPALVSFDWVVVCFLFAAVVGIFFGFYPARKAANLDPIEALRYE